MEIPTPFASLDEASGAGQDDPVAFFGSRLPRRTMRTPKPLAQARGACVSFIVKLPNGGSVITWGRHPIRTFPVAGDPVRFAMWEAPDPFANLSPIAEGPGMFARDATDAIS